MNRRGFLKKILHGISAAALSRFGNVPAWAENSTPANPSPIPLRNFGRTGHQVTLFGLGGEGVLRTYGRTKEAVSVIEKAFSLGVNYMDTAPAYAGSQDYYGTFFKTNSGAREKVFLASKTHERSYEGSMALLKDSLKRLGTDHLDLWQLHDLREPEELEEIFSESGAIRAVEEAKRKGWIRFAGITGHHDPSILKKAIELYDFDSLLVAINAADRHEKSFIEEVLPAAMTKQMGIIGMKVYGRGRILQNGLLSKEEAMGYVLSLPVSHVIIGCDNPAQVEENAAVAKTYSPFSKEKMEELEARTARLEADLTFYKNRV